MLALDLPPDPRAEPAVPTGPSPLQREAAAVRADILVGASDAQLSLGEGLEICFDGEPCARLSHGAVLGQPQAAVTGLGPADGPTRLRVQRRLQAWLDASVARLFAPLHRAAARSLSPAGRGLLVLLEAGLGSVTIEECSAAVRDLAPTDMRALARLGVRRGARYVFTLDLLKPDAVRWRAAHDRRDAVPVPAGGTASVPLEAGLSRGYYAAIGYPCVGERGIRVDQIERALAHLRKRAARGDFPPPPELLSWLGLPRDALIPTIEALGGRMRPDGQVAGSGTAPPRRRKGKPAGRRKRPRGPNRRPETW
jgi:ATP-dependent RNA helicase SUPV3L1/SUV3